MNYSTCLALLLTTLPSSPSPEPNADAEPTSPSLDDLLAANDQRLRELVGSFRSAPPTPEATLRFEQQLQLLLRERGRQVCEHTFNSLEPDPTTTLPDHLLFQNTRTTRLSRKTNQQVWTLFGQIRLSRLGYRAHRDSGLPTFFPLACSLGLIEGATPALAPLVGQLAGSPGMTQRLIRQRLRQDHGVGVGVKKLRQILQTLAALLEPQRQASPVQKVLELLEQARLSPGKHKPVLSVSRDGISMPIRVKKGKLYEVASTATLSVYDRRGKRLGTV